MGYNQVLAVSGVSTLLSVGLFATLVLRHLQNWSHPIRQKKIIMITAMFPMFAIDAYLGLLKLEQGEDFLRVLTLLKECYEGVCLRTFLALMFEIVGVSSDVVGGRAPIPDWLKGREMEIGPPLGMFFKKQRVDEKWFGRLRLSSTQFLYLRPVLALLTLVLVERRPGPHSGTIQTLLLVAKSLSVTTAFCSLVTFNGAFKEELKDHRPTYKFLSIKGAVVVPNWQKLVLKVMVSYGMIHEGQLFGVGAIEQAYQNLFVCLMMGCLFGPLSFYAFPPPGQLGGSGSETGGSAGEVEMKEKKVN